MHDVVIVGIPLLVILAGILLNRADSKDLRSEMNRQNTDLRGEIAKQGNDLRAEMSRQYTEMGRQYLELMNRFNSLDRAMNEFYHMTGKLDARMDALEKK